MTTLVQLVSEQTMQNLLPLLALKPARVVQLCSNKDQFRRAAANFESAARKAGIAAEFQVHQLSRPSPSTEEVRQAHKQLLAVFPDAVVNLTGGTKLMSLGAFLGASEFVGVPILYCDTANKSFVQVGQYPLPASLADFGSVAAALTVPVVMAAQGKEFRESPITPGLLEFGVKAWELRHSHHEAVAAWTKAIRDSQPRKNNRLEKSRAKLDEYLARPLPVPHSNAGEDYRDVAVEAGILRADGNGSVFLNAQPNKPAVEHASNLLDGGWLELAIADMMMRGTRFADVHWSVEPPNQEGEDYGETDLIAVDLTHLNLTVISCKTSTQHVSTLEHLSSWRDRSRTLGGSHAQGHLCLFRARDAQEGERLKKIGRNMNLHIHIGDDIPAFFCDGQ